MTYAAALAWLFERTRAGANRGPARTAAWLARLPVLTQLRVIHVVGTNGKGSVCAMLAAGLLATGASAARFTSPHLFDYRERLEIGGQPITEAEVVAFVLWAQAQLASDPDLPGAFFDLTVVLAAHTCLARGVQWLVLEAGVGGASDASLALAQAAATQAVVLSNVALDHVETLGHGPYASALENIAFDKAGAICPGQPIITAATGAALVVVAAIAAKRRARLYPLTDDDLFALPAPPRLTGPHQAQNAALALATLRLLGFDSAPILHAALAATWPARLERFVYAGCVVWLDGAHNPAAAEAIAAAIPGSIGAGFVLLFGAFERKAVAATLAPLAAQAQAIVFVAPPADAAPAADPQALARQWQGQAAPSIGEGLALACALAGAGGTVLVAGSLYLAGAVRELLG
jgi:dihydrofolate synthase / folylpolyglutamate synthase